MGAVKIYMQPRASRRYLLTVLVVVAAVYVGIVFALWDNAPGHPAMIVLGLMSAATVLTVITFAVQRHFLYPLMAVLYLSFFAAPIGLSLIAIVLTAGSDAPIAAAFPYAVLAYLLIATAAEYSSIDFKDLPRKLTHAPFRRAGDDSLYFDPHVSVLFLSPWRGNNGYPRFNLLRLIATVVLFAVLLIIAAALVPTGPKPSQASGVALGWILALIALVTRPFLMQHLIKLRLVLMKTRGQI